jgi:hypothetical protein
MADEIRELDVVALLNDLPEERLRRGQVGTVVMDFGPEAAEVEFVDQQGKTYALLTIPKSQLMRLHHDQIEAA